MRLIVVRGPEPAGPFELAPGRQLIGRGADVSVRLPSRRVSRHHCEAEVQGQELVLRDLDSSNGLVDESGARVALARLKVGQRVQVGDYVLRLDAAEAVEELDLEEEDPLTADDDLHLDVEDEDTPVRDGPMPVLRAPPDPGRASLPGIPSPLRPAKGGGPPDPGRLTRDSFGTPPPPAPRRENFPPMGAPAKPAKGGASIVPVPAPSRPQATASRGKSGARGQLPTNPPPGTAPRTPPGPPPFPAAPEARPSLPPYPTLSPAPLSPAPRAPAPRAPAPPAPVAPPVVELAPVIDTPTAETSVRMAPVLPFGPPTGGFGGFTAPPKPAQKAPEPPPPFRPSAPREDPTPVSMSLPPADATPTATPKVPLAPPVAVPPPPFAPAPPPPFNPGPAAALPPYGRNDPSTNNEAGDPANTRLPAVRPEPAVAPGEGLPWLMQAVAVVALTLSIILCGPVGGLVAQVWGAYSSAEALSLARGEALAEALAARNVDPLSNGRAISLDASFILSRTGVQEAAVVDTAGSVLAPPERLRTSLARSPALVAATASHAVATEPSTDGTYEIVVPIRGELAAGSGARQIIGWAWLRYDPSVAAAEATNPWLHAIAALVVLGLAAGVLAGGGYWLFVRPVLALREETELALLDNVQRVVSPVRWAPFEALAHSINRAIARSKSR